MRIELNLRVLRKSNRQRKSQTTSNREITGPENYRAKNERLGSTPSSEEQLDRSPDRPSKELAVEIFFYLLVLKYTLSLFDLILETNPVKPICTRRQRKKVDYLFPALFLNKNSSILFLKFLL